MGVHPGRAVLGELPCCFRIHDAVAGGCRPASGQHAHHRRHHDPGGAGPVDPGQGLRPRAQRPHQRGLDRSLAETPARTRRRLPRVELRRGDPLRCAAHHRNRSQLRRGARGSLRRLVRGGAAGGEDGSSGFTGPASARRGPRPYSDARRLRRLDVRVAVLSQARAADRSGACAVCRCSLGPHLDLAGAVLAGGGFLPLR